MKCAYCHHDIMKGEATCTNCGRHIPVYEKFIINKLNWCLIILAIFQVIVIIVSLIRFISGDVVVDYLKKGEYDRAISLINRYDFLQEKGIITEKVNSIISDIENDYLNGETTYDSTENSLITFSSINGSIYQQRIYAAMNTISTVNDIRSIIETGDKALGNNEYDDAITYYKSVMEKYPDNDVNVEEKIDAVIQEVVADFESYAEEGNYSIALKAIEEMENNCQNIELSSLLTEWKKKYLYDWIQEKNSKHDYLGDEGALQLSIKYDSLDEGLYLSKTIDSEYQSYIQENIESENYSKALNKIDNDYENICKYSEYFDSDTYNNYRIICSSKLLEQARSEKKYTGVSGAIKLCDKVNSYKEGTVDKNMVIAEYASIERGTLLQWINDFRSSKGLSTFNYNSTLESAAVEMISNVSDNTYDESTFENIMSSNGISYTTSYLAWNASSATAETMENGFDPVDDFGILTTDGLTDIGIGMIYNESSGNFSWFIIGIK